MEKDNLLEKRGEIICKKYESNDPNFYNPSTKKTVFEAILLEPDSEDDIFWSCKNGADMYSVSFLYTFEKC